MRARRTAALLALVTALIGGVCAAAASPASAATAKLSIRSYTDGTGVFYNVTVSGEVPTWYGYGSRVAVRLWGEDVWSDDLLDGPLYPYFDGWHYQHSWWVSADMLDEDWDGRDEIYAGVRVYDSSGRQRETAESNRVYGYW